MSSLPSAPTPGQSAGAERRTWFALGAWVLLGVAVVLSTFRSYGVTWDEGVHARYGELVVDYFRSGFRDTSCNDYHNLRHYAPLVDALPALWYDAGSGEKYLSRHRFLALLSLLVVPALALYARVFGRLGMAIPAVVALFMMPRFYGHAFTNSKDVPFAVAVAWFMLSMARLVMERSDGWRPMLAGGLSMGAVLCVRPGGLPLLLVYLSAAFVLSRLAGPSPRWPRPTLAGLARIALMGVVAWALMVACWPWAQASPLARPLEAIRVASAFPYTYPVLFDGRVFDSAELPRSYLLRFLGMGTPPSLLLLAAVGIVQSIRLQIAGFRTTQGRFATLTQCWLFLPLLILLVGHPNVYDGMRHILFVLPALAMFVGWGASAIWSLARGLVSRTLAVVVVTTALILPLKDLVGLHPYQTTYFNFLVGGLPGAANRYETDYWATSYREGMEWISKQARRHPERKVRVLVAGNEFILPCVTPWKAPNVEIELTNRASPSLVLPDGIDYYLAFTRYRSHENFPQAPVVHRVGRQGAWFAVVRGRSDSRESS